MADRYEVISFKKTRQGKVFAVRLGSAIPRDDGQGFMCWLDAIPSPGESGQYEIQIVPQREKKQSNPTGDMNDSVPF